MSKVISKTLPHGAVPFSDVSDGVVRNKIMLLNENIASLARQLQEVQKVLRELQISIGGKVSARDK